MLVRHDPTSRQVIAISFVPYKLYDPLANRHANRDANPHAIHQSKQSE